MHASACPPTESSGESAGEPALEPTGEPTGERAAEAATEDTTEPLGTPAHPPPNTRRTTEADFLALPEGMGRCELIDGEVSVSPAPTLLHQSVLLNLALALRSWAASASIPARVALAPVDIRFGSGRILQPDLSVFLHHLPDLETRPIGLVPALCIEVLSPSNHFVDRVMKRYLYGEAGVAEYWLVDPNGHIERCRGQGLGILETLPNPISSPLLPGFEAPWTAVFAR